LRILVVDDYESAAESVAIAMSLAGFDARFACGSMDALASVQSWVPDIAILDINMPSPDGFQLAAILRGSPSTRQTYIIAYTSLDADADADADEVWAEGEQSDFDAYCRKGSGIEPLTDLVSRAVDGQEP
jgi:PleD family two-component response regulator